MSVRSNPKRVPLAVRIVVATLLVLVLLYAIAGFFVAPGILTNLLVKKTDEIFGLRASVNDVALNPFTFELRVEGFSLDDPDHGHLFGFEKLEVDVDVTSIRTKSIEIALVELTRPDITVEARADSTLNLEPLFHPNLPEKEQPEEPESEPGQPFAVTLGKIRVVGGSLDVADRRMEPNFEFHAETLNIALDDLKTDQARANEPFTLSATAEDGGRFRWQGSFRKQPFSSTGQISIEGLQLRTLWRYLQNEIGFEIQRGQLDIETQFTLDLATTPLTLRLDDLALDIANLRLVPPGQDQPLADLNRLSLSGVDINLGETTIRADSIATSGAELYVTRDEEGKVEAVEYFTLSEKVFSLTAFAHGDWQWDIDSFALDRYTVHWIDQSVDVPADSLTLGLSAANARNAEGHVSPLEITAQLPGGGSILIDGTAGLLPAVVDVGVKIDAPSLDFVSVYLGERFPMKVNRGRLDVDGRFDLGLHKSDGYANLYADVSVGDAVIGGDVGTLGDLAWDALTVQGAHVQLDPMQWIVERIELVHPQLTITLLPRPDSGKADENDASDEGDSGKGDSGASSTGDATAVARADSIEASSDSRLSQHIGIIQLTNGEIAFTDSSVAPAFHAKLENFTLIAGGPSGPGDTVQIDLETLVDGESPLLVTGYLDPFDIGRRTQLTGGFENYNLISANSYAAKYAGYNLKNGWFSLDTFYDIQDRYLTGKNRYLFRDLDLGDKTDSPDAADLPLGTAIPMLRDRGGVITLNVDVEGDLDDTNFNVMEIILSKLTGFVLKIVATPFALLGSIVGLEKDDVGYVMFRPGSDSLRVSEMTKLEILGSTMAENPNVTVEIEGQAFQDQDTRAIQDAWVEAQLLALWHSEEQSKGSRDDPRSQGHAGWVDLVPLAQRGRLLYELYQRTFTRRPQSTDTSELRRELRTTVVVTPEQLSALAQRRADHIRAQLLTSSGVAEDRAELAEPRLVDEAQQPVRARLKIKS